MSWGTIAQAIFFLSIALLAIVITIFVFASSLLGRAVEAHAKDQERLRAARKEELDRQLTEAQKHLDKLREQCETEDFRVDAAITALKDAQRRNQDFGNESKSIQQKYNVFTVQGGVTFPACFLISSMFLSAIAWGLAEVTDPTSFQIGNWEFYTAPFLYALVSVSIILIGFGISRVYLSLQGIQEVAITSEEAALKRNVEAYKIAAKELEAEAAPTLELLYTEPDSLPIRIKAGDELKLGYDLRLMKGQMAENISIFIFAPPGFDFPKVDEKNKWVQGSKEDFPKHICVLKEYRNLLRGLRQPIVLTITAPRKTGKFKIAHILACRGFYGGFGEIDVEVVPKSESVK